MAVIERPGGAVATPKAPAVKEYGGWESWLTTVDHKKIGIMYMVGAFVFFVVGGIEALLMRTQLGTPNNTFLSPDVYNQMMTMHGTTMVFLVVMPFNVGLANYVVPLMIGARDMAFPRLNALSIWLFFFGGLMLYFSFMAGGAPAMGWFAYAPLTMKQYSPTFGVDYWIIGLLLTGVASIAGGLNFIVTILNMRSPGMYMNRMPLFVWMTLITSFILVFAFPSLTAGQIALFFDRHFETRFFNPAQGGDAILWMHLFWFFGHPEVYILILPTMGIISEVLSTFSRKPIFGYAFVAYSGVAIGFLGFLVWSHHMFSVGLGPLANAFFAGASMLISIPTGVKIFNWIATMYLGTISLKTPMYYAIAFVAMFIVGGISGITLASPPINLQQTDSYYVVAHFHYVLFGGAIFGIFSGLYYWFPKFTGRMYNEGLGKLQFWLTFLSFNITFFPMHITGTNGMPRRIYTYEANLGWDLYNLISTIGSYAMALGVLVFIWNAIVSIRNGEIAPDDPWDGSSLEWAVASPPPAHNFDKTPVVYSRRPLWDTKYPELDAAHEIGTRAISRRERMEQEMAKMNYDPGHDHIHLPSSTYNPFIVAFGLLVAGFGTIYINTPFVFIAALIGLVIMGYGIVGWVRDSRKDSPYLVSH
jgi:cytochrome c oxidase subunit I